MSEAGEARDLMATEPMQETAQQMAIEDVLEAFDAAQARSRRRERRAWMLGALAGAAAAVMIGTALEALWPH